MGMTSTTVDLTPNSSGASGTVTFDFSTGGVFYLTAPAANFTANFTNISTDPSITTVVVLYIAQGASAFIPSALQINGAAQTVKWLQGVTVSGSPNQVDMISYSLIRTSGGVWVTLGQFTTYV
jgi:hypothetical protein